MNLPDSVDLPEKAYKLAFRYEAEYGGCAQTTLAAIFDVMNVDAEDAFKAATGLAGGIGLSTEGACGAVIGGAMAISYFFGRERSNFADPDRRRFRAYMVVKKYLEEFKKEFGSIRCEDIQRKLMGRTFDLFDKKDWEEFLEAGGHTDKIGRHTDKCPSVAGTAAKLAVSLILEEI